jgi:hypothetical protein
MTSEVKNNYASKKATMIKNYIIKKATVSKWSKKLHCKKATYIGKTSTIRIAFNDVSIYITQYKLSVFWYFGNNNFIGIDYHCYF